jgi:hypothetical protein
MILPPCAESNLPCKFTLQINRHTVGQSIFAEKQHVRVPRAPMGQTVRAEKNRRFDWRFAPEYPILAA